MTQGLVIILWYLAMAAWIVAIVLAIVHLVRSHVPVWAIVLLTIAMLVLPLVAVGGYWLVVAVKRATKRGSPAAAA